MLDFAQGDRLQHEIKGRRLSGAGTQGAEDSLVARPDPHGGPVVETPSPNSECNQDGMSLPSSVESWVTNTCLEPVKVGACEGNAEELHRPTG
eukprot:3641398-Alexandrium_andersonii.AAC.1